MNLDKTASLRHLLTLHTVARLGSVTKAAEELHHSQSAISIQIAGLEESAGVQLIARTGHGVRLTEAGTVLLKHADRLLALWNEASNEMASLVGTNAGPLRVGAVTIAGECWLPQLLVAFVSENPRIELKLQVANREEVLRMLAANEIDIAVMGHPPKALKANAFGFAKNPMGFMAASSHPLMASTDRTLATLADSHLLVRERGSGSRATVERLFEEAGLRLRVGSELSSNESIKQMCATGFGPAFLPLHACVSELNAGILRLLPVANNPVEREWFCVRFPLRQLPRVAVVFEQFLRDKGQAEIQRLVAQDPRVVVPRTPFAAHGADSTLDTTIQSIVRSAQF